MSRIFLPGTKHMICAATTALLLTVLFSCSDDVATSVPTECIVTIEVEGDPAGGGDIIYTDLVTSLDIFNETAASFPASRSETEVLDYASTLLRRAAVRADVDTGESIVMRVYYEELHDYPPKNIRRLVTTPATYTNPGAGIETGYTLFIDFSLPVQ